MVDSTAPISSSYVVAFRTHLWDAPIAGLARRMADACPGGRFVVLTDETNGALDVRPFEKVSHTADFTDLGLPAGQGALPLWFNADYAIYALARALPGYGHYIVAEYDVAVNIDIDKIMQTVRERGLDMLAHAVQPAAPEWTWRKTAAGSFAEPWQALIPFLILSRAAIERMLATRQVLAAQLGAGQMTDWVYCEAFIPSVVCGDPDLRWAELSEFADLPHFGYRPFQLLGEPPEQQPGTIAHPVLTDARLFPLLLADADPDRYTDPRSDLRTQLARYPLERAAPYLRARWIRAGHAGAIAVLREQLRAHGLPRDRFLHDLALGKPALQSSLSPFSRGKTLAEDAAFLVSGELTPDFGNHTNSQSPIWWLVDLGTDYVIDEVQIINRPPPGPADRFVHFGIETSADAASWINRWIKLDSAAVSHDPAAPHRVVFSTPCVGRFLRINQLGSDCLHLRRVHVFGRAIVPID